LNRFREIGRRLWALTHRHQFDSDLAEEMRLHRELREQEEIERGLSPKEARYAAQRRFGNELLLTETTILWRRCPLRPNPHYLRFTWLAGPCARGCRQPQ
jgi:hypothetical protein